MSSLSKYSAFTVAAFAAVALAGCEDFNRAIGKEKVIPDEFAVVSRAPLAVPPDFSLRPPRYGAQRPQETPAVEQARQTVFRAGDDQQGKLPPPTEKRSPGEGELLREAGAANAPSDIRQLVDSEATSANDLSDSFVDKLAFWRKPPADSPDKVINPSEEAERLRNLKEAAKPEAPAATAALSGTPAIERTKPETSWLGSLF
ncbi:MAG TPA: DUF3035 domain-containing protein [Stellaceae bacterium]|nr:DUF3035 domain-containing protein [Stellaceae bacterium]